MIPNAAVYNTLTNEQRTVVAKIISKFIELGIEVEFVTPVTCGPVVSLYKFKPMGRTRVSNIEALAKDFAVTLGVEDCLVKRFAGDVAVSISVPNKERRFVDFKDSVANAMKILRSDTVDCKVPLNLGVTEQGEPFIEDLSLLPHLLIAGTTGGGKSTELNTIIGTIVYTMNSRDVQLVLSDTKGVEFTHFIGAPHLAFPPATTVYQTLERMQWIIDVTEDRLKIIGNASKRNIAEYNAVSKILGGNKLPYIVLIIDELADIMSGGGRGDKKGKIADELLGKIVQKARAAGVHVIAATQRPSVNVVAGSIKANFPARLSFRLPSVDDSRTVLGGTGAEHLLSRGDMLYISSMRPSITRLHAPYASIEDIRAAVDYAKAREAGQAV